MTWPWWFVMLIVGIESWPVSLGFCAGLLILGVLTHGWLRWAALVAALPCLAVTAATACWGMAARQRDRKTAW